MADSRLQYEEIKSLGDAVIALTQEVWVLSDRQKVLEAVLAEAGVIAPAAVQAFQPDTALAAKLASAREALINNVLHALTGPLENDS